VLLLLLLLLLLPLLLSVPLAEVPGPAQQQP
jgi:hypothetical protein